VKSIATLFHPPFFEGQRSKCKTKLNQISQRESMDGREKKIQRLNCYFIALQLFSVPKNTLAQNVIPFW
jgi:hypothetical protein